MNEESRDDSCPEACKGKRSKPPEDLGDVAGGTARVRGGDKFGSAID